METLDNESKEPVETEKEKAPKEATTLDALIGLVMALFLFGVPLWLFGSCVAYIGSPEAERERVVHMQETEKRIEERKREEQAKAAEEAKQRQAELEAEQLAETEGEELYQEFITELETKKLGLIMESTYREGWDIYMERSPMYMDTDSPETKKAIERSIQEQWWNKSNQRGSVIFLNSGGLE